MSKDGIEDKTADIACPVIESLGMELVDVEYRREQIGWVLRLYIDKDEGVTLDDCTRVSREVGTILEVEDIIDGHYHLEVSSPGLTRPLKKLEHFEKFMGRSAKVKLYGPLEGRKTIIGKITAVVGEEVHLDEDGEIIKIKYSDIAKANLEFSQEG